MLTLLLLGVPGSRVVVFCMASRSVSVPSIAHVIRVRSLPLVSRGMPHRCTVLSLRSVAKKIARENFWALGWCEVSFLPLPVDPSRLLLLYGSRKRLPQKSSRGSHGSLLPQRSCYSKIHFHVALVSGGLGLRLDNGESRGIS